MTKKPKAGATDKPRATASTKRTPSTRQTRVNKHGQALGRKGNETRQRLMDATRQLLTQHSPMELTAVSIAKEAETSSATFYIYFDDVRDIVYAMSEAASFDLTEVHRILEEDWEPGSDFVAHTQRVVDTFNDVWNRHRDILRFRNLEADRGDRAFSDLRIRSAIRIIDRFVDRILAAYPKELRPSRGEAYAEATVLFSAMEGMAATDPVIVEEWRIGAQRLANATATLLARSFGATTARMSPPTGTASASEIAPSGNAVSKPVVKAAKRTPVKKVPAGKASAKATRST